MPELVKRNPRETVLSTRQRSKQPTGYGAATDSGIFSLAALLSTGSRAARAQHPFGGDVSLLPMPKAWPEIQPHRRSRIAWAGESLTPTAGRVCLFQRTWVVILLQGIQAPFLRGRFTHLPESTSKKPFELIQVELKG
jgi:hypothetical protein